MREILILFSLSGILIYHVSKLTEENKALKIELKMITNDCTFKATR